MLSPVALPRRKVFPSFVSSVPAEASKLAKVRSPSIMKVKGAAEKEGFAATLAGGSVTAACALGERCDLCLCESLRLVKDFQVANSLRAACCRWTAGDVRVADVLTSGDFRGDESCAFCW